jgi:hypothetical protein
MDDTVIPPQKSQCFDNCPICKALIKAHEENRELSQEEMEEAISEAEDQEKNNIF